MESTVLPSLLDRLTDLEPKQRDRAIGYRDSVERFRKGVQRDLQWLLNTRQSPMPAPEELEQLHRSIFDYGLPDLSSVNRASAESRETLVRHVREAIALFEPRLRNVRVSPAKDTENSSAGQLHFVVMAELWLDPTPEGIAFDTVLDVVSGQYEVKGVGGA